MIRTLIVAALSFAALPAFAGEGLFCDGPDGLEVHIPLGAGPGITPIGAEIKVAGKRWTMDQTAKDATILTPAQAASVDNRLYIDFTNDNFEGVVVELRLFWTEEETDPIYGGTMRIAGQGAWVVSCGMG